MSRDPLSPFRRFTADTTIHALEWGAAIAIASVGSPGNLGWRMVACGLVAAMSVQRGRRAEANVNVTANANATAIATPTPTANAIPTSTIKKEEGVPESD